MAHVAGRVELVGDDDYGRAFVSQSLHHLYHRADCGQHRAVSGQGQTVQRRAPACHFLSTWLLARFHSRTVPPPSAEDRVELLEAEATLTMASVRPKKLCTNQSVE